METWTLQASQRFVLLYPRIRSYHSTSSRPVLSIARSMCTLLSGSIKGIRLYSDVTLRYKVEQEIKTLQRPSTSYCTPCPALPPSLAPLPQGTDCLFATSALLPSSLADTLQKILTQRSDVMHMVRSDVICTGSPGESHWYHSEFVM